MGRGQRCRVCGCSDLSACAGGCWWFEDDLCSACVPAPVPDPQPDVAYDDRGRIVGEVVGYIAGVPVIVDVERG